MEILALFGFIWMCMAVLGAISEFRDNARLRDDLRDKLDRTIRVIELEKLPAHGGLILAYDAENNQFLGQGMTITELKQAVMSRFPERIFLLDKEAFSARPDFKVPK